MYGSDLRWPGLVVLVNGTALPGVIGAEVSSKGHYAADRFHIRAALSATGTGYWASQADLTVEIRMGLGGAMATMIQGDADQIDIDPISGIVAVEGRDRTAALIEARTQETFSNRTASEIAGILAARHGLDAAVTPTTTPVGRYYQLEHDRITLNQFSRATTEWDLLIWLAQREGFDIWVKGNTLHFESAVTDMAVPSLIRPQDCIELRLERSLALARDIEVTVKSWNSRQQNAFTQTARRKGGGRQGAVQRYTTIRPNLTPDEALQLAQRMLAELSRFERVVTVTVPGELSMTPRSLVALAGTGSDFDQVYHVAEIERRIGAGSGFLQRLRLKNLAPASQATLPTASIEA